MSYILDALKKSDKERKQAQAPAIETVYSPERKNTRNLQPVRILGRPSYLLATIIFLGALIWFGLHLTLKSQNASNTSRPQATIAKPSPKTIAQKKQSPEMEKTDTPEDPPSIQPKPQSVEPQTPPIAAQEIPEPRVTHRPNKVEQPTQFEKPARTPQPPKDSPSRIRETPAPSPTPPASQPVAQKTPAPATSTVGKHADIPLLSELSQSIQEEVSELDFAGHAFEDSPSRRMIMINNKILREGDIIKSGLHLKEITETGVILKHKTTLFRVNLF